MDVSTYLTLIWLVVAIALGIAAYVGLGGRALLRTKECPGRILGRRAQLTDLEGGPRGLDRDQPRLPPAIVERFVPEGAYLLRFEAPVSWLARTETQATISARFVGYPVSLATGHCHTATPQPGR
jgi:hypothetical protein